MHDSLHNQFCIKILFDGMQNFIINDTLGKGGPFLAFSVPFCGIKLQLEQASWQARSSPAGTYKHVITTSGPPSPLLYKPQVATQMLVVTVRIPLGPLCQIGSKPLVSYSKPSSDLVEFCISVLLLIGHASWTESICDFFSSLRRLWLIIQEYSLFCFANFVQTSACHLIFSTCQIN